VTAQTDLKGALREGFGQDARRHGYRGSVPTWRKANAAGDWLIVNVQSSSFSTSESLRCVINISAAPEPWLRWQRHRLGTKMPKSVTESLGLFRDRVHPTGTPARVDGWWEVTDESSAGDAATDMSVRMEEVGWAPLDAMLTRAGMLEKIRAGDLGLMKREDFDAFFACAEALLLMDAGPSEALELCLARALEGVVPTQRESAEEFDAWVRSESRRAPITAGA